MANNFLSFDEEFQPEIEVTCNSNISYMEEIVTKAKSSDVDVAEKLLDDACANCIESFTTKIEDIRAAARKAKPDPLSPTFTEDDNTNYALYARTIAVGIEKSNSLFDAVIERLRNITSSVIKWIQTGATWMRDQLVEAFTMIKSLWIR